MNPFKSSNKKESNDFNKNDDIKPVYTSQFKIKSKSGEPPKKIYYEMNNEDFPELIQESQAVSKEESNKNKSLLDFKNASLKESKPVEICEELTPGWLHMKYDKKNNKILKKQIKNENYENNINGDSLFEIQVDNAINNIIERHNFFIEKYGIDNYERDYHIESYCEMSDKYEDCDYEYECEY